MLARQELYHVSHALSLQPMFFVLPYFKVDGAPGLWNRHTGRTKIWLSPLHNSAPSSPLCLLVPFFYLTSMNSTQSKSPTFISGTSTR
jgi:hypothetical protein